jgi:hypothetical protein
VRRVVAIALLALVVVACSSEDDPERVPGDLAPIHMNEIQTLGSHNSYHAGVRPALLDLVRAFDAKSADSLDYSHPSLTEQLEDQGARQLELDVWSDPDGGLYRERRALALLGEPTASGIPELDEPGFKVLHAADLDFESTCLTFVLCLDEVRAWSDRHPTHLPVLLMVEAKYTPTPDPAHLGFVDPPDFDRATFAALDAEIRTVFDDDDLVVPADVTADGWPDLRDARGKVWFALDNDDLAPVYGGDILFTAGNHFAKLNDPVTDRERIASALRDGLIVRTRADADTVQARTNDTSTRTAAFASGAQYISTDYLVRDPRFSSYVVVLPGGVVARCNPVNAPPSCTEDRLKE